MIITKWLICILVLSAYPIMASSDETDRIVKARQYFGDEVLVNQNNRKGRFYSDWLNDKVVLIHVIFSNCHDACPMAVQKLKKTKNELGERFSRDIFFLSLSIDPERDSPEKLKEFAELQKANVPGWDFLVADPEIMEKILSRLGQWSSDPTDHSTLMMAGNTRTAHWVKIPPSSSSERIAQDLLRLTDDK